MGREHVDHRHLVNFADERVNLPQLQANKYRAQVRDLRSRLENHLAQNPDFDLVKMLLSGSLAKGTALRTLNDIDVAIYVKGDSTPAATKDLLDWLAERLRNLFPNIQADQVKPQTYSVTISFRGSGLDVDVVPIIYHGDPQWRGELISQDDGTRLMTSIPMHLDFIRTRKSKHDRDFAQVIRFVKFWARRCKSEIDGFRFKSFMAELILAHLSDKGIPFTDYPEALAEFFNYILTDDFRSQIIFADYYDPTEVRATNDRVQIFDPVNPENNVGFRYHDAEVTKIIDAAMVAADAIDYALHATSKSETTRQWQRVFGTSFQA